MKKLVAFLVVIGFTVAAAPMADAGGRGGHYRHPGHYRHSHGDHFWIGLGVGVLSGAIASSFYYAAPAPPRRVVYTEPQTVIVHRAPTVVVPPERRYSTLLPVEYGQVKVTPAALNLRGGPGVEYQVAGRLKKGDVLDVIESAPGWFYVRTPDGVQGWVMDQYTEPVQPVG